MLLQNGYVLAFPEHLVLSDDEFFELCMANPDLNLERDKNKQVIIMSPSGSLSDSNSTRISGAILNWNDKVKLGKVFGSSAGFTLPDGSVKSPDCALVSKGRWNELSLTQKKKFAPVCPEFVVEIKSPTDSIDQLKSKMTEWMANGVKLGWLVDVEAETILVFKANESTSTVTPFNQSLSGGDVLPGFEFDLSLLLEE